MIKIKLLIVLIFTGLLFSSCEKSVTKPVITIEDGKIGIIGYGSLASVETIEEVLGRPYKDSLYYVHLENYERVWNFASHVKDPKLPKDFLNYDSFYIRDNDTISFEKVRFLNIAPSDSTSINCILYFVTLDELDKFDDMEIGYARIDVTDDIKEYNFKNGRVVAYKALPEYEFNPQIDEDISVVDKNYWDLVWGAYHDVGDDFGKEFENSTQKIDSSLVVSVIRVKIKEDKEKKN